MKKFAKIAVLCLSAVALMGMSGCNNDNKDPDDPIVEKEVKVIGLELAESITVDCGATQKLEAKVLPENATNKAVTWSSDNPNIATVSDDGTVTGVANGSTVVKCTTVDGGYVRECAVTVRGYKLSNKVSLSFNQNSLFVKSIIFNLTVTFSVPSANTAVSPICNISNVVKAYLYCFLKKSS